MNLTIVPSTPQAQAAQPQAQAVTLGLDEIVMTLNALNELEALREDQSLTRSECSLYNRLKSAAKAQGCDFHNGYCYLPKGGVR